MPGLKTEGYLRRGEKMKVIKGKSVPEVRSMLMRHILDEGYEQKIEKGSFENSKTFRIQSRPASVVIEEPTYYLDMPKEITYTSVFNYFVELLTDNSTKESDYTYGQRISVQLDNVMEMLSTTKMTNQAVIEIGAPEDIMLGAPPCMRIIQFMVYNKKLNMLSYFRSNDVGEAFLYNHYAMGMLLSMVAEAARMKVGEYIVTSMGFHMYSHSIKETA